MARGIRYLIKRLNQVIVLSVGLVLFFGLCFISLSQAKTERLVGGEGGDGESGVVSTTSVMQVLMVPPGGPIDKCLLPKNVPDVGECKPFLNIDEEVLQNLLQNYTRCLDDQSFRYNFSNQPVVKLSRPLVIYGRTDEALVVSGLKLAPAESFPKGSPAIVVYGKGVDLKNLRVDGFEVGILYASDNNRKQRLIGGEIKSTGDAENAIIACHSSPVVDGTNITGYTETVSVVSEE